MPLLDEIRRACRFVAQEARQVTIARDRLPAYARGLASAIPGRLQMDPETHVLGEGEATVAFFLTLDAVNFGSGYFPALHLPPGRSGYFAIAGALTRHFRNRGPLTAQELSRMSAGDCLRLFGLDSGNAAARELMELFAASFQDLGHFLLSHFDGSFLKLTMAADGSAERLVTILAGLDSFRDIAFYSGREIPFFKRAQIAAADLHIAFAGGGPGAFADVDRLTIFADNRLPHVLREDGILLYAPPLANRIAAGQLLPAGGPEEVEIRAAAVEAAELLLAELRRLGKPIDAVHLDNFLWHRGEHPRYRKRPRHRTLTTCY